MVVPVLAAPVMVPVLAVPIIVVVVVVPVPIMLVNEDEVVVLDAIAEDASGDVDALGETGAAQLVVRRLSIRRSSLP